MIPALLLAIGLLFTTSPLWAATWWPPLAYLTWAGLAASVAALFATVRAFWPEWKNGLSALLAYALFAAAACAAWPFFKLLKVAVIKGHDTAKSVTFGLGVFPETITQAIQFLSYNAAYTATLGGAFATFAIGFLLVVFRMGSTRRSASEAAPWQGAFMSGPDLTALRRNKSGLPLGLMDRKIIRYAPNESAGFLPGHDALLAGTRGGKGVSCILPAILEHHGPIIATDIKGELAAMTRDYRASLGRKVAILNAFNLCNLKSARFNPFDWIRDAELVGDAFNIADGIIQPETGSGAYFASQARDVTAAAIEAVYLSTSPGDPNRSIPAVADMLQSANWLATFEAWATEPGKYGQNAANAGAMMLQADDKEKGFIRSTLGKNFQWLADNRVREMLSKSSFSLDWMLDDKLDLFVCVPLQLIGQQSNFLRLMTNLVVSTVLRQDGKRTVKAPILTVLDEFTRLGKMDKLLDVATVAAGAGVKAMFVAQNIDAMQDVYGEKGTATLLASCATVRVFGLGRGDVATARWAEQALPEKTVIAESQSASESRSSGDRRSASTSKSTSEQRQKVMTAPDILEMPADEILCLIRSKPALRLKRIISHKNPAYRGKLAPNPTCAA